MKSSNDNVGFSIGSVVRTTGIPAATLRNWERRYGFPSPERSEGGQRIYSNDVVKLLLAIARALEEGSKPSEILRDPWDYFREASKLQATRAYPVNRPVGIGIELPAEGFPLEWREAVMRLDGVAFERSLERLFMNSDMAAALDGPVSAFLNWVGAQWLAGMLQPYHEHFATEQLRLTLGRKWSGGREASGPTIISSTLPGEQHDLGGQMVAAVLAAEGCHPVVLGRDLPVDNVVEAAGRTSAVAVAISVVMPRDPELVPVQLREMRDRLPRRCELLAGGNAIAPVEGVTVINSLAGLAEWVRGYVPEPR